MRSVEEWIGKTDDSRPPAHVRLRIFNAHNGVCHISGRKITAADQWDLEHVQALCNGGKNREANLAPALRDKHKEKTTKDRAEKAKTDALASRHLGIRAKASRPMAGSRASGFKKKMNGEVVKR